MLVQHVLPPDGSVESWTVLGDDYAVVEPIEVFLAHLSAIERSPGTVRSYAFDLWDYFTFLDGHRIDWATVRLEHLGWFVAAALATGCSERRGDRPAGGSTTLLHHTGGYNPAGLQMHSIVEGRLSCWGICEQGHWWGLVTYGIAYGARHKAVTHWIPAWTLKRKPETR